jgi:hypothetical protein
LDRGPGCYAKVSSNLLRLARFPLASSHRHFCANLLNLSNFRCRVKQRFCWNQACNVSITGRQFYPPIRSTATAEIPCRRRSHCAKISNNNQRQIASRISRARKEFSSRVMQWVCSLRDSLQGLDELLSFLSALRTGFPLPHSGQAQRPPGGSTATSATFQE